jgi:hypothetical protein
MDVQKVAFAPSSALFATPSNSSKTKSVFETGLLLGAVVSCRSLRRSTESPNVPYPMPSGNSHYIFMSFANGCADPFPWKSDLTAECVLQEHVIVSVRSGCYSLAGSSYYRTLTYLPKI